MSPLTENEGRLYAVDRASMPVCPTPAARWTWKSEFPDGPYEETCEEDQAICS